MLRQKNAMTGNRYDRKKCYERNAMNESYMGKRCNRKIATTGNATTGNAMTKVMTGNAKNEIYTEKWYDTKCYDRKCYEWKLHGKMLRHEMLRHKMLRMKATWENAMTGNAMNETYTGKCCNWKTAELLRTTCYDMKTTTESYEWKIRQKCYEGNATTESHKWTAMNENAMTEMLRSKSCDRNVVNNDRFVEIQPENWTDLVLTSVIH